MNKKISTILALFIFFIIPHLFAAHKVTKVFSVNYRPVDGITVNNTFSGNYGIVSFTSIDQDEMAFLCSVEKKVKIFNTESGRLIRSFSIHSIPRDFAYADGSFYILSNNRISQYRANGTKVMDFPINNEFKFIDRLQLIDGKLLVLTSEGNSYTVLDNGTPIDPETQRDEIIQGWIFRRGFSLNTLKVDPSEFIINFFENGEKTQERHFYTDRKLGCAIVIGMIKNAIYIDVQYITNEIPLRVEREIWIYSSDENRIIDIVSPPDCYYLTMKRDFYSNEDGIVQLITTEDRAELLKLSFDRSLKKTTYPEDLNMRYHYNHHLPGSDPDLESLPESRMNKPQQSITRSEILAIADAYETIEWTCSAENTTNHQLIQLPDESYIRTPVWVVVGNLRRVPYKWGGFTHVDNFNNRIFNGAYAGDDYCVRGDAFAVSYGDTYCVGVDCSGFVSRAWGLTEKEWTGSLPNISTALQSWSSTKKGDIANKAGSHTMLIVEDNPSGTLNVIHANGSDWAVSYWTYPLNGLVDYIPRKYNHVIDDPVDPVIPEAIVLHQNYPNPFNTETKFAFYLPQPSTVNLIITNIRGQFIETVLNEHHDAGNHTIDWNASHNPSGLYFYRIQVGQYSQTRKCVVVK